MKQCTFIILLFTCVATATAQFDNVGTSAAAFLKIGVGSRAEAMGGAIAGMVDDPSAMYWNVAGLAHLQKNEIMLSHNDWIIDLAHTYFGAGFPIKDVGIIGVSVIYLSMDPMMVTTWERPEGTGETFSAYSAAIGLAYARHLTDKFSVGIQGKYVVENISQSDAKAFALDVGGQYNTGYRGLRIGMTISNFGSELRMEGRDLRQKIDPYPTAGSNPSDVVANLETASWPLPLYFQLGIAMNLVEAEMLRVTGNFDFRDERDYRPIGSFGVEVGYDEFLFLRGGTSRNFNRPFASDPQQADRIGHFSVGGGVHYQIPNSEFKVKFDYSYTDLRRLTQAHRITVGLIF